MRFFLDALRHTSDAVELAVAPDACSGLRADAEEALQALRSAYKQLAPDEKEAAKPLAALLSRRLADASRPTFELTPTGEQPAKVSRERDSGHQLSGGGSAETRQVNATTREELQAAAQPQPQSDPFAAAFAAAVAGDTQAEMPLTLDFDAGAPTKRYTGELTPEALLAYFGYASFRPGQRDAIQAGLDGRDVLVVMPTGQGKSLCYQLPGVATDRLTVVVTPLVALMRDQYQRLARDGHPAVMLASGLGDDHNREALAQIWDGAARMVFCSPERFASAAFNDALASRDIGLFVVDEAHCVSEWGHDFRPDYLRLHTALERLGNPPVMACTATATPQVAAEIAKRLKLRDPLVIQGGFDRPNLSFDVVPLGGDGATERKMSLLAAGLSDPGNVPAIVYCGTRKDVEQVAERLQAASIPAVGYHAGMTPERRQAAQERFMSGACPVVVATNAFGMGVDKADVRSVWHWAIPTSVEAYYQEAGRAGRDGQPGRAVLLAMRSDLGRLISFNKRRSTTVQSVQQYLTKLRRRARGAQTFLMDPPDFDEERISLAIAERSRALVIAPAAGGKLEITLLGPLDTAVANACCETSKKRGWDAYRAVERFSSNQDTCRRQQLLSHFGDTRAPAPAGRCCDVCETPDWLPDLAALPAVPRSAGSRPARTRKPAAAPANLAPGDAPLLDALREWRKVKAGTGPAYTVAKNATLEAIAAKRPSGPAQLQELPGVGPAFLAKYGDDVLALVAQHN